MPHFAGLDWGGAAHAVCVVDEQGRVAARFEVAHTAGGLAELRSKLARFGDPAGLPVAIERPSGLLVDTLLDAGHPVVPIHPDAVKAARLRYRASGAKSDGADSFLLADQLRALLGGYWPGAAAVFADLDSPIALAFVRRYPTPDSARRLGEKRLAAFLAQHSYWPGAAAVFAD